MQDNGRTKKANKIDYDKAFEQRQAKIAGTAPKVEINETPVMSKEAKGMAVEAAQEALLAE